MPKAIRATMPIPPEPSRVTAFRLGPWAPCSVCKGPTRAWFAGRALHMVCAPRYMGILEYMEMIDHATSTLTVKENA